MYAAVDKRASLPVNLCVNDTEFQVKKDFEKSVAGHAMHEQEAAFLIRPYWKWG